MEHPTTAASGAPSQTNGSSGSRSSRTGRLTASASSDPPPAGARATTRRRRSGSAAGRLFRFDRSLGTRFVAGADEAGRGCLAGPLVAAGVLFDLERIGPREVRALSGLNDSKQQLPEKRAALFPVILRVAAKVVIVSRCAPGIDSRGLHKTNLAALRDALTKVACPGCICLSDGFPVGPVGHEQMAVVGGDGKSAAIAAASVIAKETRDRYMRRADEVHPGWEFASHVGYSTPEHREAIERLGISPLHRRSFQSAAYLQLGLGLADDGLGLAGDGLGLATDGLGLAEDGLGLAEDGLGLAADGLGLPAPAEVPPELLAEMAQLEPRTAA